jgi:protein O-GlcNAc transferase
MDHSLEEAIAHHRSGNLQNAEMLYQQILQSQPNHPDALNLLGVVMRQQQRLDESQRWVRLAIAAAPSDARYPFNLGETLRAMEQYESAVAAYQSSLELDPHNAPAWHAMGMALEKLGRDERAIEAYRGGIGENGGLMSAHQSLFDALWRLQRLAEAEAAARAAIGANPDWQRGYSSLGLLLDRQGRGSQAAAAFRRALQLNPNDGSAHGDLANVLADHFALEEAIDHCRRAVELLPQSAAIHSNLLLMLNLDPRTDEPALFAEHQLWAARHAVRLVPKAPLRPRDPRPDRPLRIGYISPDFRNHPVTCFFEPILSHHDRRLFTPILYSDVAKPDSGTGRLAALAGGENWRPIHGLGDDAVAALVQRDGIDVLVDLAGHTAGNRLPLFARGIASVQVTYLGCPNTTGLPRSAMQFRVTDADCDPPGLADSLHTEELMRLEDSFLCYRPPPDAPPVAPPPCQQLGYITFGSFCSMMKINRQVLGAWSQILARVPDSRLMIKNKSAADPDVRQRVMETFASLGVVPQRILLLGHDPTIADHLERYAQIDIALDTFPYNGTTTTCEALWMGVPLVTLTGQPHRSRVSFTLLKKIGLADLATPNVDRYIELTAELAQDRVRLASLRAAMRSRFENSELRDEPRFVGNLESAFRAMWRRTCVR